MLFAEALISFMAMQLLLSHLSNSTMRKLIGYKGYLDVLLHGSVMYVFFGTSTEGLIQAEAAAIMFSLWLRLYAKLFGYERMVRNGWRITWVRTPGRFA
jgi:hypothetical protein